MELKIIKTESEYKTALAEAETLIALDPEKGTPEAEKLHLLSLLIKNYEDTHSHIEKPDPIEAINFRMEQQGLSPRDLIPFIGSRSKVSEVLSSKRPLTLSMIRALHHGLNIPAEVLLKERKSNENAIFGREYSHFPVKEMIKRGWIAGSVSSAADRAQELVNTFFEPLRAAALLPVFFKRTVHQRSGRKMDEAALLAWIARIQIRALESKPSAKYSKSIIDVNFMREVARLSWSTNGPALAKEFLFKHGIIVIIESHLPGTYIDGAAMIVGKDRNPVIGLSLRYDRIDNFWFCLMHELAHLSLHFIDNETDTYIYVDDLDIDVSNNIKEIEADRLAGEALIPRSIWKRSRAFQHRSVVAINELASQLKIHPAIIAGRIRHDSHNFRALNNLIGHGEVRKLFPEFAITMGD